METINSIVKPVEGLKKRLFSKKMLFIAIVLTIQFVLALINTFGNRIDLNALIKQFEENMGTDLSGFKSAANVINTIIFVVAIISCLPSIVIALAFWFVYLGASNDTRRKLVAIGLMLFRIYALAFIILYALYILIAFVAMLVVMFSFIKDGSVVAGIIGGLVGFLVAVGTTLLFLAFYTKLYSLCVGIKLTFQTGKNCVCVYKYLIFAFVAMIVLTVFSMFSNGLIGILTGVLQIITNIFFIKMLNGYKNEVGSADPNEVKDFLKEYRKNPMGYKMEADPDYVPEFSVDVKDFKN